MLSLQRYLLRKLHDLDFSLSLLYGNNSPGSFCCIILSFTASRGYKLGGGHTLSFTMFLTMKMTAKKGLLKMSERLSKG